MERIGTTEYYNHPVHIEQSITLEDARTGEIDDCNIVTEAATLIFDANVVLTVGEGKTLIPDLYNVYANIS